jgi:uncharacterized protein YkwD
MGKTHNQTAAIPRWLSRSGLCAVMAFTVGCSTLGEGPEESHTGPDATVTINYPDAGSVPPTPGADAAPPAPQADAGPPSGLDDEQSLFQIINEERVARGLSSLTLRADLTCAARAHSFDIGTTETCSMVGSGGETPSDRVEACGGASTTGAVVGCGYFTARGTVNAWIDNEDIAPYLLAPAYESVGVGWHNDYWTAIFDD